MKFGLGFNAKGARTAKDRVWCDGFRWCSDLAGVRVKHVLTGQCASRLLVEQALRGLDRSRVCPPDSDVSAALQQRSPKPGGTLKRSCLEPGFRGFNCPPFRRKQSCRWTRCANGSEAVSRAFSPRGFVGECPPLRCAFGWAGILPAFSAGSGGQGRHLCVYAIDRLKEYVDGKRFYRHIEGMCRLDRHDWFIPITPFKPAGLFPAGVSAANAGSRKSEWFG